MRIPASGGWRGRLAKLAMVPAAGLILAACGERANNNATSDAVGPSLFGETANGIGFPHDVVTTEGIASAGLYLPIFIIAVVIFILVEGLLLYTAWRFRRRDRDQGGELPRQVHGNSKLELIWTAIPALIVTVLFIGSAVVLADIETESDDPAVVLNIEAYQFGWTFKYMDPASYDPTTQKYAETGIVIPFSPSLASSQDVPPVKQEAVLPVDVPIRFRLQALDVIHSFYVPAFFFKRDAFPGRINEFELTIEEPGVYGGQCAEFCGLNHGRMFFTIRAVEQAEYDTWVAEQTGAAPTTAAASPGASAAVVAAASPGASAAVVAAASPGASAAVVAAASPGASAAVVAAASPGASAAVVAAASPETAETLPPATEAVVLELSTPSDKPISFASTELEVKAGQQVTVRYTNESKVPHNVTFYEGADADAPVLAQIGTITGPGAEGETTFTAPDTPGQYFFRCELHPLQMTGTLTVVS